MRRAVAFDLRLCAALLLTAFGALFAAPNALSAPTFPALTGRVVDQANIISPEQRASLEGRLKELEDKSGIQLVVATVSSASGSPKPSPLRTRVGQLPVFGN